MPRVRVGHGGRGARGSTGSVLVITLSLSSEPGSPMLVQGMGWGNTCSGDRHGWAILSSLLLIPAAPAPCADVGWQGEDPNRTSSLAALPMGGICLGLPMSCTWQPHTVFL